MFHDILTCCYFNQHSTQSQSLKLGTLCSLELSGKMLINKYMLLVQSTEFVEFCSSFFLIFCNIHMPNVSFPELFYQFVKEPFGTSVEVQKSLSNKGKATATTVNRLKSSPSNPRSKKSFVSDKVCSFLQHNEWGLRTKKCL